MTDNKYQAKVDAITKSAELQKAAVKLQHAESQDQRLSDVDHDHEQMLKEQAASYANELNKQQQDVNAKMQNSINKLQQIKASQADIQSKYESVANDKKMVEAKLSEVARNKKHIQDEYNAGLKRMAKLDSELKTANKKYEESLRGVSDYGNKIKVLNDDVARNREKLKDLDESRRRAAELVLQQQGVVSDVTSKLNDIKAKKSRTDQISKDTMNQINAEKDKIKKLSKDQEEHRRTTAIHEANLAKSGALLQKAHALSSQVVDLDKHKETKEQIKQVAEEEAVNAAASKKAAEHVTTHIDASHDKVEKLHKDLAANDKNAIKLDEEAMKHEKQLEEEKEFLKKSQDTHESIKQEIANVKADTEKKEEAIKDLKETHEQHISDAHEAKHESELKQKALNEELVKAHEHKDKHAEVHQEQMKAESALDKINNTIVGLNQAAEQSQNTINAIQEEYNKHKAVAENISKNAVQLQKAFGDKAKALKFVPPPALAPPRK